MRFELMDYLLQNTNTEHPYNNSLTWGEISGNQFDSLMAVNKYAQLMRTATPNIGSTMWGGELEMQLFARLYSVNIAVYVNDVPVNTYMMLHAIEGNLGDQESMLSSYFTLIARLITKC